MNEYLKLLNEIQYDFIFDPYLYNKIEDPVYKIYREILVMYLNDNHIKDFLDMDIILCKFNDDKNIKQFTISDYFKDKIYLTYNYETYDIVYNSYTYMGYGFPFSKLDDGDFYMTFYYNKIYLFFKEDFEKN